jgi:hypothetical protein
LDLGEQGMSPELADETTHALAAATSFQAVGGWGLPESALEVAVGESVDQVFAGEDRVEQVGVGAGDGVEARVASTVEGAWVAEGIELGGGGGSGSGSERRDSGPTGG